MKRIGISQRLDKVPGRDESRDALDVCWGKLLWSLGYLPEVLCSGIDDVGSYLGELRLDGFILSGGNDIGSSVPRDRLEEGILNYCKTRTLPVLGICRGMQLINNYQNGSLCEVKGHVACRHQIYGSWSKMIKEVNSYHNKAVTSATLGQDLDVLAMAHDEVVEAFRHTKLPWLGVMWHPEREVPFKEFDKKIMLECFG